MHTASSFDAGSNRRRRPSMRVSGKRKAERLQPKASFGKISTEKRLRSSGILLFDLHGPDDKLKALCETVRLGLHSIRDEAIKVQAIGFKNVKEIVDFPMSGRDIDRWGRQAADIINRLNIDYATRYSFEMTRDASGMWRLPASGKFLNRRKQSWTEFEEAFNRIKQWHTAQLDQETREHFPGRRKSGTVRDSNGRAMRRANTFLKTTYVSVVLNPDGHTNWQRAHYDALSEYEPKIRKHQMFSSFLNFSPRGVGVFYENFDWKNTKRLWHHGEAPVDMSNPIRIGDDEFPHHCLSFCARSTLHQGARGAPGVFLFTMDEEVCYADQPGTYPEIPQLEQTVPPLQPDDLFVKCAENEAHVVRQHIATGALEYLQLGGSSRDEVGLDNKEDDADYAPSDRVAASIAASSDEDGDDGSAALSVNGNSSSSSGSSGSSRRYPKRRRKPRQPLEASPSAAPRLGDSESGQYRYFTMRGFLGELMSLDRAANADT